MRASLDADSRRYPRAGDRGRTGDIQIGNLTLYQLSYARIVPVSPRCHSFNSVTALNVSSVPKLLAPIGYG